ncbi:MAG: helix-turn-helix domain-containing protein [Lentisphaerae bacterium]|nr:helix-turn-helix domain-containing protein [Lentisphaerota bacterium]
MIQELRIRQLGKYTFPQSNRQILTEPCIGFFQKGFDSIKLLSPSGQMIYEQSANEPFLMLGYKGCQIDFKANKDRENWVIMLEPNALFQKTDDVQLVKFHYENTWLTLPIITVLEKDRVESCRRKFQAMHDAWQTPLPINQFRVECGIVETIHHILNTATLSKANRYAPEQVLKNLIDEDRSSSYNLSELSKQCGYSSDYLRILFHKRYNVSPVDYRQRQRMTHAMNLITSTDLSVQAIARRIGFRHDTHFCTTFKKRFGLTPLQAIKTFRHGVYQNTHNK